MKKIAIIPAYNESSNIRQVVKDIADNAKGFDYLIINDGSTDGLKDLCSSENLISLHLPVNLGIGGAVQAGYMYARDLGYDIAVQFDGDGQHEARFLNQMIGVLIERNLDMVIGSRFIEKEGFQSTKLRKLGIGYFTKLIKLITGQKITDPTSGMRMVNRKLIRIFAEDYPKDYPEPESLVQVLLQKRKVAEVPVTMKERAAGVSSISLWHGAYYMIKVSLAIIIVALRKRDGGK